MVSSGPRPPMSDEDLVNAARSGSATAFTDLVERHDQPLRRYFNRVLGDQELAADLTQETFLELLRALPRYDRDYPFKPWLYGVANNVARRAARERAAMLLTSLDRLVDLGRCTNPALQTPDPSSSVEERDAVQQVLDLLSDDACGALLLARLMKLSMRDVGQKLGIGEAAARQRVHRAAAAFRAGYAPDDGTKARVVMAAGRKDTDDAIDPPG